MLMQKTFSHFVPAGYKPAFFHLPDLQAKSLAETLLNILTGSQIFLYMPTTTWCDTTASK